MIISSYVRIFSLSYAILIHCQKCISSDHTNFDAIVWQCQSISHFCDNFMSKMPWHCLFFRLCYHFWSLVVWHFWCFVSQVFTTVLSVLIFLQFAIYVARRWKKYQVLWHFDRFEFLALIKKCLSSYFSDFVELFLYIFVIYERHTAKWHTVVPIAYRYIMRP